MTTHKFLINCLTKCCFLLVLIVGTTPNIAAAGEGFKIDTDELPEAIQNVLSSVFLLANPGVASGTAFLVHKKPGRTEGETEAYFLTSDHVLDGIGCLGLGPCQPALLTSSWGVNFEERRFFLVDDKDLTIKPDSNNVWVVKRSDVPDLALIRSTVSTEKFQNVEPINVAECSQIEAGMKVYQIGYPNVTTRKSPAKPILDARNYLIRRWSEGYVTGRGNSKYEEGVFIKTTADTVFGNSGGPTLNEKGEVIGLVDGVEFDYFFDWEPYVGDEIAMDPHTRLIPCEYLRTMVRHGTLLSGARDSNPGLANNRTATNPISTGNNIRPARSAAK